jgi:hypothetical protein
MAAKKIEIIYDINGKAIDVAIEKTLNLQQQAKALTAELRKTSDPEAFKLLSNRLGDVNDGLAKTNAKSKDLFGSLSMLPGPVGDLFGQLSGSIDLLKTFSSFSFKDLKFQLGETASDIGDIGKNLLTTTEAQAANTVVTEAETVATAELAVATEAATVANEELAVAEEAATAASGPIGLAIAALGFIIAKVVANWDALKDAIMGTSDVTRAVKKSYEDSAKAVGDFDIKLSQVNVSLAEAKKGFLSKKDALKEYNDKLGATVGYANSIEMAESLMAANTGKVVQAIGLRAQATALYAEASKKTTEEVTAEEVGFFSFQRGIGQSYEDELKNRKAKLANQGKELKAKADELLTQAIELESGKVKGLAKPPEEPKTGDKDPKVEARKQALEELKKLDEDAFKATLTAREKEEYEIKQKYSTSIALATKYGQDTTILKAGQLAELTAMQKGFDDEDAKNKKDRLEKEKDFWKKAKEAADEKRKKEAEIKRDILLTDLQAEINAIDKKNALLDYDFEQDLARLQEKRKKIDEAEKVELANTELNEAEKNKVKQKYADLRAGIDDEEVKTVKAKEEAKYQIALAGAQAFGALGSFFQQIAKENKDLAITGLLIEKAASLASIAINAQKNFIKDGGVTSPLAWANLATATISAASVVFAAIKGVQDINNAGNGSSGNSAPAANSTASLGRNYGDGGMIEGPRHAAGGMMVNAEGGEAIMTRGAVTMFAPLLSTLNQMGGGTSFGKGVVGQANYDAPQSSNTNTSVIKTYVVSNELTSQAEKNARLKDLSTL